MHLFISRNVQLYLLLLLIFETSLRSHVKQVFVLM